MFEVGSYVVYGKNGICRVEEIGPRSFGGQNRIYYRLSPVFTPGEVIYVPVEGGAHMRRPVTSQQAIAYIRSFPGIQPRLLRSRAKDQLVAHYQELLGTQELEACLALIKEGYIPCGRCKP